MEFDMKVLLAILIATVGVTAVSDHADARRKARSGYVYRDYGPPPPSYYGYGPPPGAYRQYRPGPEYSDTSDSMECIQARDLDPGGNYSGYPCWAQRAFAPKKVN